jgi:signal recognition particle subunit SRP54
MFETLTKGFRAARNRLQGLQELTEENLEPALRDVRLSLLEADVELGVVKRFLATVKRKAVGETRRAVAEVKGERVRIGPHEIFIKICQDELEAMMRADGHAVVFAPRPAVTSVMMVGLQGSGKTTTSAKLARWLEKERGRKPLLVAADVQRPGAIEQLQVLGQRLGIPVFAIPGGRPVDICVKGLEEARKLKRDTVIFDTAGRLAIDEPLMQELADIKERTKPQNVLLVVDAMIGQDSVKTAKAFHDRLGLTGVVLTKLDGDARGGAALSIKEVTGAPVRFVGTGEGLEKLEAFRADGMASRILGFGDIVGLMKDFEQVVDAERAEADARRMLEGRFTLEDFLEQIRTIQRMGPLKDVFEKLPMFGEAMPEGMTFDDRELKKVEAVVSSMTRDERKRPELFQKEPTRIARVAKGSGRKPEDVIELLQRFAFMRRLMEDIGQQAGFLAKLPGMKQLALARKMKDVVRTSGLEANPLLGGIADELLQAAVAGHGPDGPGRMLPPGLAQGLGLPGARLSGRAGASAIASGPGARKSVADRDKKKQKRKMEKKARKKSRK